MCKLLRKKFMYTKGHNEMVELWCLVPGYSEVD